MRKKGECCMLSELKVGQNGKILGIEEKNREIRRHLLDMGIIVGTIVEVKKIAPFGDPIDIKLRDYELCVCKNDLSQIIVEVIWKKMEQNRTGPKCSF